MPAKTADVPTREVKYGCDSETATQDDLLSDSPQKRLSSSPSHRGRSNVSKSPSKRVFRKIWRVWSPPRKSKKRNNAVKVKQSALASLQEFMKMTDETNTSIIVGNNEETKVETQGEIELTHIKEMMQNYQKQFVSQKQIAMVKEPSNDVVLMRSNFEGRSPTIFFQYPDYCTVWREFDK